MAEIDRLSVTHDCASELETKKFDRIPLRGFALFRRRLIEEVKGDGNYGSLQLDLHSISAPGSTRGQFYSYVDSESFEKTKERKFESMEMSGCETGGVSLIVGRI